MKKLFTLTFAILNLFITARAQDTVKAPVEVLRHEMTPAELLRKGEIGKNFVETDPPAAPIRNVAESDRMQGALVRYPFGIPILVIKEMAEDVMVTTIVASNSEKTTVLNQYTANGVNLSHCNFLIAPTNSYWTRDYGPWFASDSSHNIGIVDFPYNRPRPLDDEIPKKVATMLGISWYGMNLISTGGNYMTDGHGTSSSTQLVWEENPTFTHEVVAQKVHDYLGIENYYVRPDPNGTYIDHIDCWGKFLAPDKILIRKVPPSHSRYAAIEAAAAFWATAICSYGYPYKVFRVNTPQDQPYTNSVILNNKVLVPFMNSTWDDSAKVVYQNAMPGYEVIGFIGNPSTPWESTDALHCRVMGIADLGILFVDHHPIWGTQPCEENYIINADIIACSDSSIKNDSVLIWYKVNNGSYQSVSMVNTSDNHYSGTIPRQTAGSTVKYYLSAADNSGRHSTAPFIGAADPFSFTTGYTNIAAAPDTLWFETHTDAFLGKTAQFHNYLTNSVSFENIEMISSGWPPWYVDSLSVQELPHIMNPGDSVCARVKVDIPVSLPQGTAYEIDTLNYLTSAGPGHIIIMVNPDILSGIEDKSSQDQLGNNFPNPFTSETNIPVTLLQPGIIRLNIFNINGKLIRELSSGSEARGEHLFIWDGRDGNGNKMAAGIYFYRLTTSKEALVKRMLLIR